MAIKKLEHVGVMVKNMETSVHFYEQVLGLDLMERFAINAEVEIAFLGQNGQIYVELVANGSELPDEGKVNHIAFTADNMEEEITRLKSQNVTFASKDYHTLENGTKFIFFQGPDGERLELFQPAQ